MDQKTKRTRKVPKELPTWIAKACWDATACYLKVVAKNESHAWEQAWKQVARTFGGDSCLKVVIIRRIDKA